MEAEELEITDFEKVIILELARMNSKKELESFQSENFDEVHTYAQFKNENSKLFSSKQSEPIQAEQDCYMIPITVKGKFRINNEEKNEQKGFLLTDSNGYGMYIFCMETKNIIPASGLREQRNVAKWRYRNLIDKGEITTEEIDQAFDEIANVQDIDGVTKMIEEGKLDLDHIQELVDEKIKENKGELSQEPEENENEIVDGKENSEEEIEEKSERMGISKEFLDNLAKTHECSIDQISFRKVDDPRRVSDDIGLTIQETRGRELIAIRINYPSKQKYYLVDVQTGEHLRPRNELQYEDLPELEDYFKFHQEREGGEDYAVPIGYEMATETDYPEITIIDSDGKLAKEKFVNNGREEDMVKSQRERYLAEVNEANQDLAEKIEKYQDEATPENWVEVNNAIRARIAIDKKYSVLENQKALTIESLENTIENIHDTAKEKQAERAIEDEDDYDQYGRLIPGH